MEKFKNILWGIFFIIIGVLIGLNSFEIINVDLLFDGWWTAFIIVPCFIGLLTERDKLGNLIGLIVGIFLLLWCQDIISIDMFWKLLFPIILITIGISIIFKNIFFNKLNKRMSEINKKSLKSDGNCAIFSGQTLKLQNEKFKGTNLTTVFGGIELDLKDAIIEEDSVINIIAVFGGVDIFVPDNIKIKIVSSSIFGGVDEKKKKYVESDEQHIIYINATCIFGGVDIK